MKLRIQYTNLKKLHAFRTFCTKCLFGILFIVCFCIEDQLLFLNVYWLWWVTTRNRGWRWFEELASKAKNMRAALVKPYSPENFFQICILNMNLCFTYHQMERYQKYKIAFVMSESPEKYVFIAIALIWISYCFTSSLSKKS